VRNPDHEISHVESDFIFHGQQSSKVLSHASQDIVLSKHVLTFPSEYPQPTNCSQKNPNSKKKVIKISAMISNSEFQWC